MRRFCRLPTAKETPTEFGRADVPTSIDRKLLRSSDDPTCRHQSTGNSYGVRTIRRADIYRQETPTEFGRSDVPTSIDRKLLRSSDDPTCRQLSTGNSYGVDPSHEAWICQGTVRKSRVRSPIVVNTRRIEPNIDVIGPIRSRRFSCPSTPVSAQESTVRPLPP